MIILDIFHCLIVFYLSYFSYGINWPNQNQPVCKIRLFVLVICWAMATWSFVGASFDRYLCSSSSVNYRAKSTIRTSRRFLTSIFIISIFIYLETLYCYDASISNVPVACYTQSQACQVYNDWMNILYNIVIPSGFMAVFGVLTVLNIRKRLVHPMTTAKRILITNRKDVQPRLKTMDRNLRKILFIQVSIRYLFSLINKYFCF